MVLLVANTTGCLPEPGRPGYGFDGGAPIVLDVPAFEFPTPSDLGTADQTTTIETDTVTLSDSTADLGLSDASDSGRSYPRGPYGTAPGQFFSPFVMARCQGGTYPFDGPDWLTARATLLLLDSGWCTGCESASRTARALDMELRSQRLRVLEVLVDGSAPGEPPDPRFCAAWRTLIDLSHPLLLDLGASLSAFWSPTTLPVFVVIDASATITSITDSSPRGLAATRTAIETALSRGP